MRGVGFMTGAPVRVEGPGQPSGPDGIRLERAGTSGYWRLIMHEDRLASVAEAWVWSTEAKLLLRRLTT